MAVLVINSDELIFQPFKKVDKYYGNYVDHATVAINRDFRITKVPIYIGFTVRILSFLGEYYNIMNSDRYMYCDRF